MSKGSALEREFAFQLDAARVTGWERELLFCAPTKLWRFDFAWSAERVAVELDGGGGHMAHGSAKGLREGARKANAAACLGWTVLRGTKDLVSTGELLATVERVLAIKRGAPLGMPPEIVTGSDKDLANARVRARVKRWKKRIEERSGA